MAAVRGLKCHQVLCYILVLSQSDYAQTSKLEQRQYFRRVYAASVRLQYWKPVKSFQLFHRVCHGSHDHTSWRGE